MICRTFNVSQIVMISLHRLSGVKYSFWAKRVFTFRLMKNSIMCSLCFSVLFNIVWFFKPKSTSFHCHDLLLPNDTFHLYKMGIDTVINFVLPVVSLVISNLFILQTLRQSVHLQRTIMGMSRKSTDKSNRMLKDFNRYKKTRPSPSVSLANKAKITKMFIVVFIIFISTHGLELACNIVERVIIKWNVCNSHLSYYFLILVEISNLAIVLNSAINIVVYCKFSKKYRTVLRSYVIMYILRNVLISKKAHQSVVKLQDNSIFFTSTRYSSYAKVNTITLGGKSCQPKRPSVARHRKVCISYTSPI